jgi:acyl-CoA synthetase (AMP-forming)/AMP-acid ligase II
VTLDGNSTPAELRQILAQCEPSLALAEARYMERCRAALEPGRTPTHEISLLWRGDPPAAAEVPSDPTESAFFIPFTSGSTGRPKGIVISQRALYHRITDWIRTASLTHADEHLCPLTLTHVYGCNYASLPSLSTGATLHLMDPLQTTPHRVLRYVAEHRITCFYNLPYFYQLMTAVPTKVAADLSSLRLAMCAAAPLSADHGRAFFARFGVPLNNCYGLSETGLITANLDREAALSTATIGKAVHGMEVRPLSGGADGGQEEGELVVRSRALADGYLSTDDGPMLREGWLHTGDLARRDADGSFHIVGRISQFINVAGNKVMPTEIEAVIEGIAGVREVAVVGVADPRTTQKVAAFVVAEDGLSADQIRQHCRLKMAEFKIPAYVEFRAELPKSPLGKILKTDLRLGADCR